MATEQLASEPAADRAGRVARWDRLVAWALLATLAVLGAALVLSGERESSLGELRQAVVAGEVAEVGLSEGLPVGADGWTHVRVRWQGRFVDEVTTVVQASDPRAAGRAERGTDAPVVIGEVAEALGLDAAGVRVVEIPAVRSGTSIALVGITGPGWLALGYLAVLAAALVLSSAREPWWATRWAWGWLMLLVPVAGVVGFLLLGGPTGLARPRHPDRRLTGGWGFLLALLIQGSAGS